VERKQIHFQLKLKLRWVKISHHSFFFRTYHDNCMFLSKNRYFFCQLVENLKSVFSKCNKSNLKYLRKKGLVLCIYYNNSFVSTQCPMKHNYTAFAKMLTGIYHCLLCFGAVICCTLQINIEKVDIKTAQAFKQIQSLLRTPLQLNRTFPI
jgi:hypothetical protein